MIDLYTNRQHIQLNTFSILFDSPSHGHGKLSQRKSPISPHGIHVWCMYIYILLISIYIYILLLSLLLLISISILLLLIIILLLLLINIYIYICMCNICVYIYTLAFAIHIPYVRRISVQHMEIFAGAAAWVLHRIGWSGAPGAQLIGVRRFPIGLLAWFSRFWLRGHPLAPGGCPLQ